MTLVVFPLLKLQRQESRATAEEIGSALVGAVAGNQRLQRDQKAS